jgi:trk system potassium uptake protein TrkA
MSMNIIIIGCGRVGAEIAYSLYREGHKVVVIDQETAAFRNLPPDFRGLTLQGEVLTLEVLQRAGIEHAHALAAVTPSDSVNTVIGHIARVVYKVPNIVVRNYEPRKRALHDAFGLQVISPSTWGAERISELLSGTALRSLHSAGNGEVGVHQFVVPPAWHGRPLADLLPQDKGSVSALTRAGRAFLPGPGQLLEAGDILLITATHDGVEFLRAQIQPVHGA